MGEVAKNSPIFKALFSIVTMQVCFYQVSTASCIEEERESLLKLKASFIDSSNRLASWKGIDCCSWDGVGCNQTNGHVVKLDLRNYRYNFSFALLSNGVDSSLFELKYLNYLDLSGNSFNYTRIPDRLASMLKLRYLNLSLSYFSGRISNHLGNLTKLLVLDLNNKENPDSRGYTNRVRLFIDNFGWISSLSSLEYLGLSGVNPPSNLDFMDLLNTLPTILSLKLSLCGLQNTYYNYAPLNSSFVSKIQHLDLSHNMFEGVIPASLGNLSSLEYLDISNNMLRGGIPTSIGKLSNLKYLFVAENNLDGVIGESFGQLQNLKEFDFSKNALKGVVSEIHFANLSLLESVTMNENSRLSLEMKHNWVPPFQLKHFSARSIKGFGSTEIPRWFESQKEILYLDLFNTSILGPIPTWLRFQNLYLLDLSSNQINGSVPKSIGDQMPNMVGLFISNTQINGPLPHSICRMKDLRALILSNNKLSGTIPSCLLIPTLILLDLSSNKLSGVFPSSSQNLSDIALIHLARNKLEGEPLVAMRSCESLSVLDLEGNKFSGNIPTWVGERLGNLKILNLRGNKFNGTIPSTLWLLPYLHILILADNKLVGNISSNVGNFCARPRSRMDYGFECARYLGFSYAVCYVRQVIKSKELNYSYYLLPSMVNVDLSKNNLDGPIPSEITTIKALVGLNLSHNNLTGTIPVEIGRIESLESLDLSFNQLSGTIPNSMSSLNSLGVLKLSNNNFTGHIPKEGHLSTFNDASTYEGNPYLCGDPLSIKCPNENLNQPPIEINDFDDHSSDEEDKDEKMWFYIVVMIGYALGFFGVVGALILNRSWRHAYFQFIEETKDKIYVAILVNMARFKRRMRRKNNIHLRVN